MLTFIKSLMSHPKKAFFPGSFDPFTKGHEDIVLRALALFDEVIIGIGQNSSKSRYFPLDKMEEYIRKTFEGKPVSVVTYQNLTANVARNLLNINRKSVYVIVIPLPEDEKSRI